MSGGIPREQPVGAAQKKGHARVMETVLHIGCHRSGSTTFQSYLRNHSKSLRDKGVVCWDPRRTRGGLFSGLLPAKAGQNAGLNAAHAAARAVGRVRLNLAKAAQNGAGALLVSDENMIGSVRANLRAEALYPAIGDRMARIGHAFEGHLTRIVLVIRAQDRYWPSAISYGIARGCAVPDSDKLARIAEDTRTWRDVITDLACAAPDAEICVIPFEAYCANPETLLGSTCKLPTVRAANHEWLNRAPDANGLRSLLLERGDDPDAIPPSQERWQPFTERQLAQMKEQFEDDLFWLAAGAGGLATLTEEAMPGARGKAHRDGTIRGQRNDEKGQMERAG